MMMNQFPWRLWLDGNYMENFADFTVDGKKFSGLKEYTVDLQGRGQRMVVMLYGGLSADAPSKYVPAASGALIKNGSEPFEAQTFSNKTRFLDWFHDGARGVWEEGLFDLWDAVPFDGLWLDMNAPTIFCDGGHPNCANPYNEAKPTEDARRRQLVRQTADNVDTTWYLSYGADKMTENSTYWLPFIPQQHNLDHLTIALNATHNASAANKTYTEYDVHALFGHMQAKTTSEILNSAGPTADYRKLISSTSTFAGTGQYAQHSLSGQRRTWQALRSSIAAVMNMNMFGIPFTGADVCGAQAASENQTAEEQTEVCARWYQLSTFYPLARTNRYRDDPGIEINPYDLDGNTTHAYNMWALYSITERYVYARFMYGCQFEASQTGKTCFDPLFYHYPTLEDAYDDIEHTFIVNDAVKVSPVLHSLDMKNKTTFNSYFPPGKWLDLNNYTIVNVSEATGEVVPLEASTTVKKHLRPGYIIPIQHGYNGTPAYANNTEQLADTLLHLIVNRDDDGYATGNLFIDEGKNISEITTKTYEYYQFELVNKTL
jgi:alpha-glucosidase (family GH31 glycosyl hydrolase)